MPLKLPDFARHSCAVLSIDDSNPWIEQLVMQENFPARLPQVLRPSRRSSGSSR